MATSLHNIKLSTKQKGMLYAFLGYTGFAFADTCAKWLSDHYSFYQVANTNYLVAVVTLLLLAPKIGGFSSLKDTATIRLQIFRGLLNFGSSMVVLYSLTKLPIASVYTMIFAMPFFSILIAIPLYKERIHLDRIAVLLLGFAGIVIAFKPWEIGFDTNLVWPLLASSIIALMFVTARSLKEDTSILALGLTPAITAFLLGIPFVVTDFIMPDPAHILLMVFNGICVCIGVVFVSLAFKIVSASLASPFIYSEMIWALLFGFLIFSDVPSIEMVIGAILIIGCGLYLVRHEK